MSGCQDSRLGCSCVFGDHNGIVIYEREVDSELDNVDTYSSIWNPDTLNEALRKCSNQYIPSVYWYMSVRKHRNSMYSVKADIPCSLGGGRRGFDPRQLRRTKRAFFPPLAI
jgi:hypothetical protein